MKKNKLLITVMTLGLLFPMTPVKAAEEAGTGQTLVGYTSSGSMIDIPAGPNGNINTGDRTAMGQKMVLFGLSSACLILLILTNRKEREETI